MISSVRSPMRTGSYGTIACCCCRACCSGGAGLGCGGACSGGSIDCGGCNGCGGCSSCDGSSPEGGCTLVVSRRRGKSNVASGPSLPKSVIIQLQGT